MIHKRFIPLCAALLMALTAASAWASDGRLDVVVSIKPIHALVAGVMQGVGTPHLLLNDQQSPHHFALKPSQARLLQQAELVFWVDPSLETPMPALLASLAPHAIDIRFMADQDLVRYQNEISDDSDDDHDDHEGHEDHEGHGRGHMVNPHIWLDLENARRMVWYIAATLSAVDPQHAGAYASIAAKLDKRLVDLH